MAVAPCRPVQVAPPCPGPYRQRGGRRQRHHGLLPCALHRRVRDRQTARLRQACQPAAAASATARRAHCQSLVVQPAGPYRRCGLTGRRCSSRLASRPPLGPPLDRHSRCWRSRQYQGRLRAQTLAAALPLAWAASQQSRSHRGAAPVFVPVRMNIPAGIKM
eukprot:356312-Chlamydomonas_euryale.AAC.9